MGHIMRPGEIFDRLLGFSQAEFANSLIPDCQGPCLARKKGSACPADKVCAVKMLILGSGPCWTVTREWCLSWPRIGKRR